MRSLQVSPRAPFRRIARALGVSEQTVARRYRALQRNGILRVVAVVDPAALGESSWVVRIQTRPNATLDLGRALARRPDVAWVSVAAGGSEVTCLVRSPDQQTRERLLVDKLPRTSAVLDITASVVMRRFVGGNATDWVGLAHVLSAQQVRELDPDPIPVRIPSAAVALTAADTALLQALARDGRAPIGVLARASGLSEGRTTRRLAALREQGVVNLDLDLASAAIGYPTSAYLWLTVAPAHLDSACQALTRHEQTPFVAAVTGRSNVLTSVVCRSLDDLYTYVTRDIGAIEGVHGLETSLVLRRLKQAGTVVDGDRLAAG